MTVQELINKLCILVESNPDIAKFIVLREDDTRELAVSHIETLWPSDTSIVIR